MSSPALLAKQRGGGRRLARAAVPGDGGPARGGTGLPPGMQQRAHPVVLPDPAVPTPRSKAWGSFSCSLPIPPAHRDAASAPPAAPSTNPVPCGSRFYRLWRSNQRQLCVARVSPRDGGRRRQETPPTAVWATRKPVLAAQHHQAQCPAARQSQPLGQGGGSRARGERQKPPPACVSAAPSASIFQRRR